MGPRRLSEKEAEERRRIKRRKWLIEQDFLRRHDQRKKKMIAEYERARAQMLSKNKLHRSSDDINKRSQQENISVHSDPERISRQYDVKSEVIKEDLSRIKVILDNIIPHYNAARNQYRAEKFYKKSNSEDKILPRRQDDCRPLFERRETQGWERPRNENFGERKIVYMEAGRSEEHQMQTSRYERDTDASDARNIDKTDADNRSYYASTSRQRDESNDNRRDRNDERFYPASSSRSTRQRDESNDNSRYRNDERLYSASSSRLTRQRDESSDNNRYRNDERLYSASSSISARQRDESNNSNRYRNDERSYPTSSSISARQRDESNNSNRYRNDERSYPASSSRSTRQRDESNDNRRDRNDERSYPASSSRSTRQRDESNDNRRDRNDERSYSASSSISTRQRDESNDNRKNRNDESSSSTSSSSKSTRQHDENNDNNRNRNDERSSTSTSGCIRDEYKQRYARDSTQVRNSPFARPRQFYHHAPHPRQEFPDYYNPYHHPGLMCRPPFWPAPPMPGRYYDPYFNLLPRPFRYFNWRRFPSSVQWHRNRNQDQSKMDKTNREKK